MHVVFAVATLPVTVTVSVVVSVYVSVKVVVAVLEPARTRFTDLSREGVREDEFARGVAPLALVRNDDQRIR
jgi:methenyltetrahydromethanopterin cyclohydrolase